MNYSNIPRNSTNSTDTNNRNSNTNSTARSCLRKLRWPGVYPHAQLRHLHWGCGLQYLDKGLRHLGISQTSPYEIPKKDPNNPHVIPKYPSAAHWGLRGPPFSEAHSWMFSQLGRGPDFSKNEPHPTAPSKGIVKFGTVNVRSKFVLLRSSG